MDATSKRITFLLLLFLELSTCSKILAIFPHQMRSHFDVFEPLLKELNGRGHQVTVVGYFTKHETDVSLKGSSEVLVDAIYIRNPSRLDMYLCAMQISRFAYEACNSGLSKLKKLKDMSFDVILAEYFSTNCFLALTTSFPRAHVIALSSGVPLPWTNTYFAIPDNPANTPLVFMDYPTKSMSFLDRVENTVLYMANKVLYEVYSVRPAMEAVKTHLDSDLVDLEAIAGSASLLLVNTHFTLSGARALPPNVVEVGGIHIGSVLKLPEHIEKWINESKAGVIYFSMGSMIKGHTFPEEKRRAFLDAFAKLDQRVLWKWENETMPGKPDNVMIQKWMPQLDILCHPNVKAFVSHGGLLGTTEAVHCGVPTLAMPQFGDQHTNARALEAGGGGVVLNFADVDEESVLKALKTILDPEFNKKAKALSEKFRDRPMSAMDTAIYWIEYVARHKGADHLRTAAVGMPWYQYLLLDVVAFLATVTSLFLYFWYRITKALLRVAFRRKEKVKSH